MGEGQEQSTRSPFADSRLKAMGIAVESRDSIELLSLVQSYSPQDHLAVVLRYYMSKRDFRAAKFILESGLSLNCPFLRGRSCFTSHVWATFTQ